MKAYITFMRGAIVKKNTRFGMKVNFMRYMVSNMDNKDILRFLKNHNRVSCDINVDMVTHKLD